MRNFTYILLIFSLYFSQITIAGFITDKSTGESLIGANIFVPKNNIGTVSDKNGFYSLTIDKNVDSVIEINVQYLGYDLIISNLSINNNLDKINLLNKQSLKAVKTYSNNEISRIIDSSKQISDFIFMGIGNFKEPYTAYWIIKGDEIMPNYYIPYYITTGNGRSNGKFSIAVKAK